MTPSQKRSKKSHDPVVKPTEKSHNPSENRPKKFMTSYASYPDPVFRLISGTP